MTSQIINTNFQQGLECSMIRSWMRQRRLMMDRNISQ